MHVVLLFKQHFHLQPLEELALRAGHPMATPTMPREPGRFGRRVSHWKTCRSGQVITIYEDDDPRAGKMWVFFDDGEVELRWVTAFVFEEAWIPPVPEVPKTVKQPGSSGCSHVCMYVCMFACMYVS